MNKLANCPVCKQVFKKKMLGQKVCSPDCAIQYARAAPAYFGADERVKREDTLPVLKDKAQRAVNAYIRVRDGGRPCISCGCLNERMEAGHYRSRGAAPHLRFNTYNINNQCSRCNNQLSGNAVEYRRGLVKRYGFAIVERLEGDQSSPQWRGDYLKRLATVFYERARHLTRLRALNSAINENNF